MVEQSDPVVSRNRERAQAVKKGVVLQEVPLMTLWCGESAKIYNETPVRQGRRFPHYGKRLERVRE